LRNLSALNTVRFPIRRENGGMVELLPKGYDPESGIFTVESPGFDIGLGAEEAIKYFRELLSEFCFRDNDRERSISVILAHMLTLFCAHVLGPNTIRPAFIITANAEGSGKTLAA
jgi:hypothetical protein